MLKSQQGRTGKNSTKGGMRQLILITTNSQKVFIKYSLAINYFSLLEEEAGEEVLFGLSN